MLDLLGVNRQAQNAEQYYTPEELQLIVQESEELGAIRAESGQMLQELFEFGDLTAGEAMVPRVRITGMPVGSTPDTIRRDPRQVAAHALPGHRAATSITSSAWSTSRTCFACCCAARRSVRGHARPLPLVPETAPLDAVLATMRRERSQMAVVIDEHGGTSGVVTLQDLFEEVVGEIEEGETGAARPHRDAQGRLHVPGTMRIDELGQQFDLELEHEDVDSVSGLVLTLLGRPPRVGDTVRYDRLSSR